MHALVYSTRRGINVSSKRICQALMQNDFLSLPCKDEAVVLAWDNLDAIGIGEREAVPRGPSDRIASTAK